MTDRRAGTAKTSQRVWRKPQVASLFALAAIVAIAATVTFAVEDSASLASLGLRGIYPSTPPADLGPSEFAKLDGNWADWSKTASESVNQFYSSLDQSDAAAQRRALTALKIKQDVMKRALEDSRYHSLYAPLGSLYNRLTLRIDLAEAVLDTLDATSPESISTKSRSSASSLTGSIDALESNLAARANGLLWMSYFKLDALKKSLVSDANSTATLSNATQSLNLLKGRDYALDDEQKAFTHQAPFDNVARSLEQFIALAAWSNPAEATGKLRAELKALCDSVEKFATTGQNAAELRREFANIRLISADGGQRLVSTLERQFFNYNLRVVVTEPFLNKLIAQCRTESGPVFDCILGARVTGCQITNTAVNVDLKPSSNTARFDLKLDGHIRSNTQGVTPQATVYTDGNHTFCAAKEVTFDGKNFTTAPAVISVSPHNTTTGIATKFSGVPLLGGIANRFAARQVEAKRGEAESIAASRVSDRVLPQFNQEVDSSFATQGAKLETEFFAGLRSSGLFPDAYVYQSTDNVLSISARLMAPNQVAANIPDSRLSTVSGATALMHETVLNNAIDQLGIAGQTLNEPELREKLEAFLSKALNRPFKLEPPPAKETTEDEETDKLKAIIFATTDPVRFRIEDDELSIIIRAGFKNEGKDDIPTREITVPISFKVVDRQILATRGNVTVAAAEGEGGGVLVNAVVRKKIQTVLPDRAVDSKVEFKTRDKTVVAYVTNLTLVDGWVGISID